MSTFDRIVSQFQPIFNSSEIHVVNILMFYGSIHVGELIFESIFSFAIRSCGYWAWA